MARSSAHPDNDRDDNDKHRENDEAGNEASRGKIGLRLPGARGKLRQLLVAHRGDGRLYLLGIYVCRLQSLLSLVARKKLVQGIYILLARLGSFDGSILQVGGTHHMRVSLRGERLLNVEQKD
jgi:hypothetical protein